jgi:predicted HicB family RNase H-like nuclease
MKKKTTSPHRYSLIVEWSDEDQVWIGRCPELFHGGVHGDDRVKVYAELLQAVDEHIELARQDGRPLPDPLADRKFSGKFVLRTSPELHRDLTLKALKNGESLNNFVVKKLQVA